MLQVDRPLLSDRRFAAEGLPSIRDVLDRDASCFDVRISVQVRDRLRYPHLEASGRQELETLTRLIEYVVIFALQAVGPDLCESAIQLPGGGEFRTMTWGHRRRDAV